MPSATGITEANAEFSGEVWLQLLKVEHPNFAQPLRVVNNTQDITSNGELYLAAAFALNLPDDVEGVPQVSLEVDNVDRTIVDAVRSMSTPATVTLSVVLASTPNTIEAGPFAMTMTEATYNAGSVKATLIYEDLLNEQYPPQTFNPARYPGLF